MKRALVCLDHSSASTFVFVQAREFAECYRAELNFVHVLVPDHGLTLPNVALPPEQQDALPNAKAELTELMDQVAESSRGKVVVGSGEPWRLICWYARDIGADFIIIGAHGTPDAVDTRKHGARDLIDQVLGTTASHVVQKADRTVIVVRQKPR
jgi:nucleotide-binding universal stress UspA family protein